MHHTLRPDISVSRFWKLFAKYRERIIIRIAAVNDDRQFELASFPDLPSKNFPLYITRAVVVIVVQPDLAPGYDLSRRTHNADQMLLNFIII